MKVLFKLLFLFIIPLTFISCSNNSEDTKKTLKVGMELQFPPFETIDENGEPIGLSVDFAKYLANKLNMDLEIVNTSYSGLIPSLQSSKIDMIISSMAITEDRKQAIDFSNPYAVSNLGILINKSSSINTIDEANNKDITVAVKKGTTGHIYATQYLKDSNLMVFDKESAAILEVVQGKADIFIYGQESIYKAHMQNPDTTRMNLEPVGEPQYWGVGIKKGNTELLEKVNIYIEEFKNEGGFDKLASTYLPDLKKAFEELDIPFFFDVKK